MRISLINLNLIAADAIGGCVINQARYFVRRGDQVRIFLEHPATGIPADIQALCQVVTLADLLRPGTHFAQTDLYVYHYPLRYTLMESMTGLERGAVVFYYHNVTPPALWGSAFARDTLQHSLDRVAGFSAYADLVVTDSAFNAEQLVFDHGCSPERVRVLPLGVALEQFTPGTASPELIQRYQLAGKPVILFVGRMAGNKRIDLLIEALSHLRQTHSALVLLLVGDHQSNPAIQETVARAKARAEALGVTEAVIFTGPVEHLPAYYHLATVYASASQHEGFGVPLIEAMASGVPVVVSRATAHPWVVGEAGLLAEPDSASDLAAQLDRVLTEGDLRQSLIQRGLSRASQFSIERYTQGWEEIVNDIATGLPDQLRPTGVEQTSLTGRSASNAPVSRLTAGLHLLDNSSDVMLRGFVVQSQLPLVGALISWVRRNLTFHVREMYLDPMFERQVAFNRHVVQLLRQLVDQSTAKPEPRPEPNDRLARLETWLALVSDQLEVLQASLGQPTAPAQAVDLQRQITAIRQNLNRPDVDQ